MHRCHPAIKTYDIRGPLADVTPELTRTVGRAFAVLTGAERIVVGHDMRPTSPLLARCFADGARSAGADVLWLGLASTDQVYFASGALRLHAAVVTASHSPATENGIKLTRPGASPMAKDTGLEDLHTLLHRDDQQPAPRPGSIAPLDITTPYLRHLLALVPLALDRPLKVVVDAGNGMGGLVWPQLTRDLPITTVGLYMDLDGTFPHHDANPMDPANLTDLQTAVPAHGADLGIAFDGDADRCFLVDDKGAAVPPCALLAALATRLLTDHPGATVVHDILTSTATREIITEHGGTPLITRVGSAYVKQAMATHDALLGAEASGHYYFRDFWHADSGPLAALHALAALGSSPQPASEQLRPYTRYATSGEINIPTADPPALVEALRTTYPDHDDLDGITVLQGPNTWFNIRPSNVDPVVRLTIEAPTPQQVRAIEDQVLSSVAEAD
jgi:phosphomannomutase